MAYEHNVCCNLYLQSQHLISVSCFMWNSIHSRIRVCPQQHLVGFSPALPAHFLLQLGVVPNQRQSWKYNKCKLLVWP